MKTLNFDNIDSTRRLRYSLEKQNNSEFDVMNITLPLIGGEERTVKIYVDKEYIEKVANPKGEFKDKAIDKAILNYLEYFTTRFQRSENIYLGKSIEEFEKYLKQINPEKTQPQEKRIEKNAKHYVVGDIHGMYGSYMEVMKHLKKEDHLYIIGDVIDRGANGIKILKDIVKRKKNPEENPEITFLLGNHELQFLTTLNILRNNGLKNDAVVPIVLKNKFESRANMLKFDLKNSSYDAQTRRKIESELGIVQRKLEKYKALYDKEIKPTGITKEEERHIYIWTEGNGGWETIKEFEDSLSDREKKEIYDFLRQQSYIAVPVKVREKDYLLVHSMPPENKGLIERLKSGKSLKLTDMNSYDMSIILSKREEGGYSTYEYAKEQGFNTICGHTPNNSGEILRNKQKAFIRLDTGCGHKVANISKLTLYSIEDDLPIYIKEMEDYKNVEYTNPGFPDTPGL